MKRDGDTQWVLSPSGVLFPAPMRAPHPQFQNDRASFERMETYLCAHELVGERVHISSVIAFAQTFDRVSLFRALAVIAATIANHGPKSKQARQLTTGALSALRSSVNPYAQNIAAFVDRNPHRVIAHEQVIYWLQSLALVVCSDDGRAPEWSDVALLLAQANDHVEVDSKAAVTDPLERVLGGFALASRFNVGSDPVADLVRAYEITNKRPLTGPLSTEEAWRAMQERAFGRSFHDHFVDTLGVLSLISGSWGLNSADEIQAPEIDLKVWNFDAQSPALKMFGELSIGVDEAAKELRRDLDENGVPRSTRTFAHRPFLRLPNGRLLAASPWLVREQCRLGLWNACRVASTALHRDGDWNAAFGESFELWARAVAERALTGTGADRLLASTLGGRDEIEDVVVLSANKVMLGSAKGSLAPDRAVTTTGGHGFVAWYERFLFAPAIPRSPGQSRQKAGALRLLDNRVKRIRLGEFVEVPRDARVYPVLITFERVGDTPLLYKWVSERCEALGLLQQPSVAPITFASAWDFEVLMALVSQGASVFDILERRATTDGGLVSLQHVMSGLGNGEPVRVPGVTERFQSLIDEAQRVFTARQPNPVE